MHGIVWIVSGKLCMELFQLVGKSGELRLIFKMVKVWLSLVEFKRVKVPDPRENQPPAYGRVTLYALVLTLAPGGHQPP